MFGCVGSPPHGSHLVSPVPSSSSSAFVAEPPHRPPCTLPDEVTIAVHGADVLVNGTRVEELAASAERPTALTRLLIPCREHNIHFSSS